MDASDIKILDEEPEVTIFDNSDVQKLTMPLSDIRTERDLERWRQHNVEVASYLADFLRHNMFEEGTHTRDLFLHGKSALPEEVRESMELWDGIRTEERGHTDFNLDLEVPESEDLNIEVFDENHPRVKSLMSMERGEELNTDVINWVADYLGVPLIINYTAENVRATGIGGHAQALARTPYRLEDGSWGYDVVDPMALKPTIGIRLNAQTREDAFRELGNYMGSNAIGSHLLENRVDFNLLDKLTGTPAYDLLLGAGTSRLQERDIVNCQFMSLLIQSYLWAYYGSFYDFTKGTLPNISIGEIVKKRFMEVFNVSLKEMFDVMSSVHPFRKE
ncbi:MAG: hypothetical protein AB9915_00545 [Candidatus Dojkabacteria bacterium]